MSKIIGYHGTSYKAASNIVSNRSFNYSTKSNEWLGRGIYFYELQSKANWWAKKKTNGRVLECEINVDDDKLLNLDIPENENLIMNFADELSKIGDITFSSDKIIRRCQLLNLFQVENEHKVTIYTFPSTNSYKKNELDYFGLNRTERQICVHDKACINYNNIKTLRLS
ncbi:hypothetical protein [Staphylococcus xylosus]|uniref:hypothetical protein n=1 Tax=Staphylococcus xylosus TaxID=1288 RepID=UPI002DB600CB|nr:hypothetical protein [Staphylococcus xylosus]MEB7719723.1 hypothetical protein [Staphylococcus xylosus]